MEPKGTAEDNLGPIAGIRPLFPLKAVAGKIWNFHFSMSTEKQHKMDKPQQQIS
jgi:hypothetical protein